MINIGPAGFMSGPRTHRGRLFTVMADHPVFKRIDKYGLSEAKADALASYLLWAGYENVRIEEEE